MAKPNRIVILRYLEFQKQARIELLLSKLDTLGIDLNRTAKVVRETGKPDNSLGSIQGQGNEIDRLCGELAIINDIINHVNGIDPYAQ